MTEFELVTSFQGAEESWQGAASIFISVVFAYLAVAYFTGSKLNRSQVILVTVLYTGFSLYILVIISAITMRLIGFAQEITAINPRPGIPPLDSADLGDLGPFPQLLVWTFYTVFFGAYIAGLVFMFQIRRKSSKQQEK